MSTAPSRVPITQYQQQVQNASLPFEAYCYNWHQFILGEQGYLLPLTQAATTLHIRARGVTVSDMCSNWGTRSATANTWLAYDPTLDGDVHPINVVGPAITTNKNACLQSNSQTLVESANESAEHKAIAQKWQRIADYLERDSWDEAKRGFIFDAVQKEGTNLVEVVCKPQGSLETPYVGDKQGKIAVFQCECGMSGMMPVEEEKISCPQCGKETQAQVREAGGKAMQTGNVPVYDLDTNIIPFFNFTMDAIGAKIGGIQTAQWLQIQNLRDQMYMQTHYPGRTFAGSARWSYALRCAYALARGRWQYLNSQPYTNSGAEGHERYEEKAIYLHEEAYSGYVAPQDFEWVNPLGQKTFSIRQGQTIMEAQEDMFGRNLGGFKFLWYDQTLLDIPGPEHEELNFRDRFSDVHWSRESGSYYSSPFYSVVYIQDDITLLNTISHNVAARNAVNPVYYDSTVFEQADFSKEFVPTKNAALLPEGGIDKTVTQLPVPTLNPAITNQMQWLWQIKDSVTLVTDPMRGETVKDQTYAAQRQALDQSYGQLSSVLKSFAQCKVNHFKNQAKQVKKYWTLEQFQEVASFAGEVWTDEDVQEMCDIDLERDLYVTYTEGSEMPTSPMVKEMKFFGALQQLASIPPEVLMNGIGQDKWLQIVEKIGEFGDMGFDVSGTEIDDMTAQKRFNDLSQICLQFESWTWAAVQNAKQDIVSTMPPTEEAIQQAVMTGQPVTGTPVSAFDVITEQIFREADIHFSEYEDLEQQRGYFVECLRAEIGKPKENFMLIEQLQNLIEAVDQKLAEKQQEAHANDPQTKLLAAQKADADAETQANLELEQGKLGLEAQRVALDASGQELEAQRLAMDAADKQEARMIDTAKHLSDQEHQAEMQKNASKPTAKKK